MARRKVAVHHFIVADVVRRYGQNPTSDLLGVNYWRTVPSSTEFPSRVSQIDLFTRFYLSGAGLTRFQIGVMWLDESRGIRRLMGVYQFLVRFAPDERVRDHVFRLHSVRLEGVGVYRVRLRRRGLRDRYTRVKSWLFLADTHFEVRR